ncbi:MAG: hypothetical protein IT495_00635 [Gammaproteobacteria bacterium]|nr:hypothetical protein [Gammaproteobacteria bacterium]
MPADIFRHVTTAVRAGALVLLLGGCADGSAPAAPAAAPATRTAASAAVATTGTQARQPAMRARYAELDRLQTGARKRFNDLAWRAGKMPLDAARAKTAAALFDKAGYRLRLPKGPGAFDDVAGIEREIASIGEVERLLDQVAELLDAVPPPAGP